MRACRRPHRPIREPGPWHSARGTPLPRACTADSDNRRTDRPRACRDLSRVGRRAPDAVDEPPIEAPPSAVLRRRTRLCARASLKTARAQVLLVPAPARDQSLDQDGAGASPNTRPQFLVRLELWPNPEACILPPLLENRHERGRTELRRGGLRPLGDLIDARQHRLQ